jgi:DNA invertase Pin-like site-specific DNA recombinase
MKKLAFSYIRFSSELQTKGDSLRRQSEKAEEYALKHNLILDNHTYRDLGVSAFRGKNKAEGKLGTFLEALRKGLIPAGSFLLIENFDRLSREEVLSALGLFMQILGYGIRVVTLQDGQVFDKERVAADNGTSLILAIIQIGRAHSESATKSKRVKEAWDAKRAAGKIVTGKGPSWLRLNPNKGDLPLNKQWELVPEKVKVVQRVFQLSHDGYGQNKIATMLNEEGVDVMQGRTHADGTRTEWTQSSVRNLLRNPAVMGTFTQKMGGNAVIENYFPAIVSKALFYKVQDAMTSRKGTGGQRKDGRIANLFASMSYCLYCGSRMRFLATNQRSSYLQCLAAYSNQSRCDAWRFPYRAAENAILERLVSQKRVLVHDANMSDDSQREVIEAEIAVLKKRQAQLLSIALKLDRNIDVVATELDSIQANIDQLQEKMKDIAHVPVTRDEINESIELIKRHDELRKHGDSEELNTLRLSLQTALRRMITKIEFAPLWTSSDAGAAYAAKHPKFFEDKLMSKTRNTPYPISEDPEYLIQMTYTQSVRLIDATPFVLPNAVRHHKMKQMSRKKAQDDSGESKGGAVLS